MADTNPFYLGYYPGDRPLYKRPSGPKGPPFGDVDFLEVDGLLGEMTDYGVDVPKWVWENIKADFNGQLKASIRSAGVSQDSLERYGSEAGEDMPGAFGISISLDPREWVQDPAGTAKKTVKGWIDSIWDYDDFDGMAREHMWRTVLSDPKATDSFTEKVARGVEGRKFDARTSSGVNPLSFDNMNIYDQRNVKTTVPYTPGSTGTTVVGGSGTAQAVPFTAVVAPMYPGATGTATAQGVIEGNDVYRSAKANVELFQRNARNRFMRDTKYDGMITSFNHAVYHDLKTNLTNAGGANTTAQMTNLVNAKIASGHLVLPAGTSVASYVTSAQQYLSDWDLKNTLLGDVSSFGKSMTGMSSKLDAYILSGKSPVDVNFLKNLDTKITSLETSLGTITASMSAGELAKIQPIIDQYQGSLNAFRDLTKPGGAIHAISGGAPLTKVRALEIKRNFDAINNPNIRTGALGGKGFFKGRQLTGGDFFEQGIERQLLGHIEQELRRDSLGIFEGLTEGGGKIRTILPRLSLERNASSVDDFIRDVEKGGLLKGYLWPRLKSRYEVYTPGYWAGKAMSKVQYFGFVLDADEDKVAGIFKNSLTRNKFSLNVGGDTFSFLGSKKNFSAVQDTGRLLLSGELNANAFHYMLQLSPGQLNSIAGNPGHALYRHLIGLNGGNALDFEGSDFVAFFENMANYKQWLLDQGLDHTNAPFMMNLMMALHKRGIDPSRLKITSAYVGPLQKAWSGLNYIQNYIFELPFIGSALKGIFLWKNIAVDHIYHLITNNLLTKAIKKLLVSVLEKLFVGILGVATGGVGAVLAKLLGFVVRFIIRKVLDFGGKLLNAIRHGEVGALFASMEKSFQAVFKLFFYAYSIPIAIIMLLAVIVMTILTGGESPAAPTKMAEGQWRFPNEYYGDPGGGVPPGELPTPPFGSYTSCGVSQIAPNQCVFSGGYGYFQGSYTPESQGSNGYGHGSNNYWNVIGGGACRYALPTNVGGAASVGSNQTTLNYCHSSKGYNPAYDYYGYATDVYPAGSCGTVYMPDMGEDLDCTSSSGQYFGTGEAAVVVCYAGGTPKYKFVFGHVVGVIAGTKNPGDAISELYNWGTNSHVHIEMLIYEGGAWKFVRPENYVC